MLGQIYIDFNIFQALHLTEETSKNIVVLALTGEATDNVSGQTIHSFSSRLSTIELLPYMLEECVFSRREKIGEWNER